MEAQTAPQTHAIHFSGSYTFNLPYASRSRVRFWKLNIRHLAQIYVKEAM
jgi:hypothetical protein